MLAHPQAAIAEYAGMVPDEKIYYFTEKSKKEEMKGDICT